MKCNTGRGFISLISQPFKEVSSNINKQLCFLVSAVSFVLASSMKASSLLVGLLFVACLTGDGHCASRLLSLPGASGKKRESLSTERGILKV